MNKTTLDLDALNRNFKLCLSELIKSHIKNYVEDAKFLLRDDYTGVSKIVLPKFFPILN